MCCCGSTRWASAMAERRPFASVAEISAAGDDGCSSLNATDWLEAFAAHPRIGETARGARPPAPGKESWAASEQSGMNAAADEVRRRLVEANREYEARFGYIFIVCASGKSASEMLDILERRLSNSPHDELNVAAEEQRRITRLRLDKLLT